MPEQTIHLEKYAPDAKALVAGAQSLADERKHTQVEPIHLLVRALDRDRGVAEVFRKAGAEPAVSGCSSLSAALNSIAARAASSTTFERRQDRTRHLAPITARHIHYLAGLPSTGTRDNGTDALGRGDAPIRVEEALTPLERLHERIMLGLRLDEPMPVASLRDGLDMPEVERLAALGMVVEGDGTLTLTRRGRMVANDVISRVITE